MAGVSTLAIGPWGAEPVPPCSTLLAAEMAGTMFGAIMDGRLDPAAADLADTVVALFPDLTDESAKAFAHAAPEAGRVAWRMIQARARRHIDLPASVDRDAALAEIARVHLRFGSLARVSSDDRDFREVSVKQAKVGLEAAYSAGRLAGRAPDVAPECWTERAAQIAGVITNAVMAGEMNLGQAFTPLGVERRFPGPREGADFTADLAEGFRTASLIISARARASVRTPGHAALSGAEAALALIEDALQGPAEGDEPPDLFAVAEAVRDTLRAGLAPVHAAEASRAA